MGTVQAEATKPKQEPPISATVILQEKRTNFKGMREKNLNKCNTTTKQVGVYGKNRPRNMVFRAAPCLKPTDFLLHCPRNRPTPQTSNGTEASPSLFYRAKSLNPSERYGMRHICCALFAV